jgi:hypothetical protein
MNVVFLYVCINYFIGKCVDPRHFEKKVPPIFQNHNFFPYFSDLVETLKIMVIIYLNILLPAFEQHLFNKPLHMQEKK